MAKVVTEEGKGLYKGPAVGVQLGRGHVDLIQESALEPPERKAKLEPLKGGGIHEEEGFFGVRAVVDAHRKRYKEEKPERSVFRKTIFLVLFPLGLGLITPYALGFRFKIFT